MTNPLIIVYGFTRDSLLLNVSDCSFSIGMNLFLYRLISSGLSWFHAIESVDIWWVDPILYEQLKIWTAVVFGPPVFMWLPAAMAQSMCFKVSQCNSMWSVYSRTMNRITHWTPLKSSYIMNVHGIMISQSVCCSVSQGWTVTKCLDYFFKHLHFTLTFLLMYLF